MGYYTERKLVSINTSEEHGRTINWNNKMGLDEYSFMVLEDFINEGYINAKWYSDNDDLTVISKYLSLA